MNERNNTRLYDMLAEARQALEFAKGKTRSDLEYDNMLSHAILYSLEIIGEAASKVSSDTQTHYPQIAWRQMVGMRNRIIHNYGNIDLNIVWETVVTILPALIIQLELILPPE